MTIHTIGDELHLHILTFLSPEEIARFSRVSTTWNRIHNDRVLWKMLLKRDFAKECNNQDDPKRIYFNTRLDFLYRSTRCPEHF